MKLAGNRSETGAGICANANLGKCSAGKSGRSSSGQSLAESATCDFFHAPTRLPLCANSDYSQGKSRRRQGKRASKIRRPQLSRRARPPAPQLSYFTPGRSHQISPPPITRPIAINCVPDIAPPNTDPRPGIVAQEFQEESSYAIDEQECAKNLAVEFSALQQPHQKQEIRQLHRRLENCVGSSGTFSGVPVI